MKISDKNISKMTLLSSLTVIGFFVYGFILWTVYLSTTRSKLLPKYDFDGMSQYVSLFASERWSIAISNLAIFGILFIGIAIFIGLVLAIFLDQKIRFENVLRNIYFYPMALSFIVTGTAWRWILNPSLGLEKTIRDLGFENFKFDWLIDPDMAIYTIVIAAIWQSSGFVMALFLAGLRSINQDIIKAARMDGIPTWRIYVSIIIPSMTPIFMSALVILTHLAVKSFDLVIALTRGGPGISTDLPATFMYAQAFSRGNLGLASASATMILLTVCAVMVPYLYSELRNKKT